MGEGPKKFRIPELENVDLNLIPIMNLFTALIPFLLLSAAFFHIGVVQVTIPVASESGETDAPKEDDKVTLNVRITPASYELSASSDTLPPDVVKKLNTSVPRAAKTDKEREAMLLRLSEAAFKIKGGYTESDTCIMVPDRSISYEDVVHTMDAVRTYEYVRDGRKSKVTLFPKVVLSSLVSE